MRIGRAVGALVVSLGLVTAGASVAQAQTASAEAPTTYYLSLGDSLSQGYQPLPTPGDTDNGYSDQLYQRLTASEPGLVLEKLGCSGEDTGTMINGAPDRARCTYKTGSQLGDAVAFLKAHPGAVTHVTLTIGANDVQRCARNGTIDYACVANGLVQIARDMPVILGQLRDAGATVQLTGANYYNPFLSYWNSTSSSGKFLALASSLLQVVLNTILTTSYQGAGAGVADLAGEFNSYAYLPFVNDPAYGSVPLNVSTVCTYTYICSVGDIHATTAGYTKITDAYARAIGVPATVG